MQRYTAPSVAFFPFRESSFRHVTCIIDMNVSVYHSPFNRNWSVRFRRIEAIILIIIIIIRNRNDKRRQMKKKVWFSNVPSFCVFVAFRVRMYIIHTHAHTHPHGQRTRLCLNVSFRFFCLVAESLNTSQTHFYFSNSQLYSFTRIHQAGPLARTHQRVISP